MIVACGLQQMISTRNLGELPRINKLKQICQSLAMLDAILSPEWELRYYSFNAKWSPDSMLASMKTGSGDSFCILFCPAGAVIKGDAHETHFEDFSVETGKPWPGVLDTVPKDFTYFLDEPAFSVQESTFCIWRKKMDHAWNIGEIKFPDEDDPDGSADLLAILDGDPKGYKNWGEEYYDQSIPISCVKHIYEHKPITPEVVKRLNPNIEVADLADDMNEIGYPQMLNG